MIGNIVCVHLRIHEVILTIPRFFVQRLNDKWSNKKLAASHNLHKHLYSSIQALNTHTLHSDANLPGTL